MSEEIFLESHHPVSRRYAVLEDTGKTAFLYLTEPGAPRPVKDVVVYLRIPPTEALDLGHIRTTGDAPLLRKDLASATAVIEDAKASEFQFNWSTDGESVAILRYGEPLAFVSMKDPTGYSRAVNVSSPLAQAWDQGRYNWLFDPRDA